MRAFGERCGVTSARAHAQSGDRITIAAYPRRNCPRPDPGEVRARGGPEPHRCAGHGRSWMVARRTVSCRPPTCRTSWPRLGDS